MAADELLPSLAMRRPFSAAPAGLPRTASRELTQALRRLNGLLAAGDVGSTPQQQHQQQAGEEGRPPSRPGSSGPVRSSPAVVPPQSSLATPLPPKPSTAPAPATDGSSRRQGRQRLRRSVSSAPRRGGPGAAGGCRALPASHWHGVHSAALCAVSLLRRAPPHGAKAIAASLPPPRSPLPPAAPGATGRHKRAPSGGSRLDDALLAAAASASGESAPPPPDSGRAPSPAADAAATVRGLARCAAELHRQRDEPLKQLQCVALAQEEAALLARVIALHPTLTKVDLTDCGLTTAAARALVGAIRANPRIVSSDVLRCGVHGDAIAAAARENAEAAAQRRERQIVRIAAEAERTTTRVAAEQTALLAVAEFDERRKYDIEAAEDFAALMKLSAARAAHIEYRERMGAQRRARRDQRHSLFAQEQLARMEIIEQANLAARPLFAPAERIPRRMLVAEELHFRQILRSEERLAWIAAKRLEKQRVEVQLAQKNDVEERETQARRRLMGHEEASRRWIAEFDAQQWESAKERETVRLEFEAAEERKRQQVEQQVKREVEWQKEKERIAKRRLEEQKHASRQRLQKREEDVRRGVQRKREAERSILEEWYRINLSVAVELERAAMLERQLAVALRSVSISCELALPTHVIQELGAHFLLSRQPSPVAPNFSLQSKVLTPTDFAGKYADMQKQLHGAHARAQQQQQRAAAHLQSGGTRSPSERRRKSVATSGTEAQRLLADFPDFGFATAFAPPPSQELPPPAGLCDILTCPVGGSVTVEIEHRPGDPEVVEPEQEELHVPAELAEELGCTVTREGHSITVTLPAGRAQPVESMTRLISSIGYKCTAKGKPPQRKEPATATPAGSSVQTRSRRQSQFARVQSQAAGLAAVAAAAQAEQARGPVLQPFERRFRITGTLRFPRLDDRFVGERGQLTTAQCFTALEEFPLSAHSGMAVLAPYIHLRDDRPVLFVEGADAEGRPFCAPPQVTVTNPPIISRSEGRLKFINGGLVEDGVTVTLRSLDGWTQADEVLLKTSPYGDEVINLLRPADAGPCSPAVSITLDSRVVVDITSGTLISCKDAMDRGYSPSEPEDGSRPELALTMKISAPLKPDVLARLLGRLRFQNLEPGPEEGLRLIEIAITCGRKFTSRVVIPIKVKARDMPTELHIPTKRVLYHFQHSVHMQDSLKEYLLPPMMHQVAVCSDAELVDQDTDKLYGGEVYLRITAGAAKGDNLVFRTSDEEQCALPTDVTTSSGSVFMPDGLGHRESDAGPALRPQQADTDLCFVGETGVLGTPVLWRNLVIGYLAKSRDEDEDDASPRSARKGSLGDELLSPRSSASPFPSSRRRSSTMSPRAKRSENNLVAALANNPNKKSFRAFPGDVDKRENTLGRRSSTAATRGRKATVGAIEAKDAREIKVDLATDGSATIRSVQALIRSLAFASSRHDPPLGTRGLELTVKLSADSSPRVKESGEAPEYHELHDRVEVRVTLPLLEVPAAHQILDWRERSPPQRLGIFELPDSLTTGVESFSGGFLSIEMLSGWEDEDVLNVKQGRKDGDVQLQQRKVEPRRRTRQRSLSSPAQQREADTTPVSPAAPNFTAFVGGDDGEVTELGTTVPLGFAEVNERATPAPAPAPGPVPAPSAVLSPGARTRTASVIVPDAAAARAASGIWTDLGGGGEVRREVSLESMDPGTSPKHGSIADSSAVGVAVPSPRAQAVRQKVQEHVEDRLVRRRDFEQQLQEGATHLVRTGGEIPERSDTRTSLPMTAPQIQTVYDVFFQGDGRRVGMLTMRARALGVRFSRRVPVGRKEIGSFLRSITFCNTSKDPQADRKVVRVVLGDGTPAGGWSSALLQIDVTKINDVTEFLVADPRIRFRPAGVVLNTIGVLPVAPQGRVALADPDTKFFDGGFASAEVSVGAVRGDAITFLTPGQQSKARQLLWPDPAEAAKRPALAAVLAQSTWNGTLHITDDRKIRTSGPDAFIVGDVVRPDRLTYRVQCAAYDPPRITIELMAYVLNCMAFVTPTDKLSAGTRVITLRVNDADNPVEGRARIHVEVCKPLLWCGAMEIERIARLVVLRVDGVTLMEVPVVTFVTSGKEMGKYLTQGFIDITVNWTPLPEGSAMAGAYSLQFREGTRVRADAEGVFLGGEYIGRLVENTGRHFRCEFGWSSKATAKAVAALLSNVVVRWAGRGGSVLKGIRRSGSIMRRGSSQHGSQLATPTMERQPSAVAAVDAFLSAGAPTGPPVAQCVVQLSDGLGDPAVCNIRVKVP